jgi:hypothetical protein
MKNVALETVNQLWSWIIFLNTIVLRKLHTPPKSPYVFQSVNLPSTHLAAALVHYIGQQGLCPKL